MVETFLSAEGYRCSSAPSVDEAWEIVRSCNVDCILLDVNLPGQSGMAMLKPLRKEYPNIAVVMMTVRDDAATVVDAVELGVQGFLAKPCSRS